MSGVCGPEYASNCLLAAAVASITVGLMPPTTSGLLEYFPFAELPTADVRDFYGFDSAKVRSPTVGGCMLGNYAAACVLRELRTTSKAMAYHHPSLDLHIIMELPTDLLYEIFQHLHPIDLFSLIRTNKILRALLLNKDSYSIWRNSYSQHSDIPCCPSDTSYPRWTTLLFGPDKCHKCGGNYAMPDIAFRSNYCESCIMRNYVDRAMYSQMLESHPDHKEAIWHLLPYSYQWSGYTYFKGEFRRQYLADDISHREQEIKSFLERLDANIPGAIQDFKLYKSNASREIKRYMIHVEMCNSWFMEMYRRVKSAHSDLSLKLAQRCIRILVKRGCNPRDISISLVQNSLHASHITRLRGLRFRSVLKRIEAWVTVAAKARQADEKKDLLQKRQKLVDDMYHKFANSRFPTDMWSSLPPASVVRQLEYFKDFINLESEDVGDLSAERSIEQLSAFIETSFEKPKRALTLASLLTTGKMKDYLGDGHENEFDVLELATSVFSCPPCEAEAKAPSEASALVGWNELKNHLYCTTSKERATSHDRKGRAGNEIPLRADKGGTKDAISLLKFLGLDPSTTTAEQLDKLDPRLLCMCCPREVNKGVTGRKAMGWRECLAHLHHSKLVTSQGTHYVPSWTFLSEEATKSVRYHEQLLNPFPRKSSWSCVHCSAHFQHGVRRKYVTHHIKNEHMIERPRQDVDFVYVPGKGQLRKELFPVTLVPSTNLRCLKCPEPKNLRLWSLRSLMAHLSDKHGMREDFDSAYIAVPIAERASDQSLSISS